jgi:hypothetical protein
MDVRSISRFSCLIACAAALAVVFYVSQAVAAENSSVTDKSSPESTSSEKETATTTEGPSHQVIACYFHRTVRCPTCKKISAYIDESVNTGFVSQVKDGSVKMMMIDFQDAKNQKYTQAYKISGPTLVIMDVQDGKVTSWKPAPKVWSLVANKPDFFKYVQGEVKAYLEGKKMASR